MPALPETMTAIAIRTPGGPEALAPETRPLPVPGRARSSSGSAPPASTVPT